MKKIMLCIVSTLLMVGIVASNPAILELSTAVYAAVEETGSDTDNPDGESDGDSAAISEQAAEQLQQLVTEQEIMALVYLADEYIVRSSASREGDAVLTVASGQQVHIEDILVNELGEVWAKTSLFYEDGHFEGYILREYLACSDERFLAWEMEHINQPNEPTARSFARSAAQQDISQFPASYQPALYALKAQRPNWTFVKMDTNLDWSYVVREEMKNNRSLVPDSWPAEMKSGPYGQGWSQASEGALKYYLDPRNWLAEDHVFQFELLTYNAKYHTEGAVQNFLKNSFMKGVVPKDSRTYARVFCDVGKELGVSPFHLSSRAYQEQGSKGTSPLISGTYPGYEGYYNYYNISASGTTNTQVFVNGLTRAKKEGWNTPVKSIRGGADLISKNYIRQGQDTSYLQKFDVDPTGGLFWHQYMQAIMAPANEGKFIRGLYADAGALDNTFVFKIPVYNNMPAAACPMPKASYDVNIPIRANYTDNQIYLDGVPYTAQTNNGNYTVTAPNGHAKTAVMYRYQNNIPVGMYVWTLTYRNGSYTATPRPEFENLLTYHGFSIRITGRAGIRFKTGLNKNTRANLLSSGGLSGYRLKEYGTLVMSDENRAQYPFILGGTKVSKGVSYGTGSNGQFINAVYELVNNRYRYTSVLIGLPPEQYKTAFAFRGYIRLTDKSGQNVTIYGPPVARSIYSIAEQVLTDKDYPDGSASNDFLQKIIDDAK